MLYTHQGATESSPREVRRYEEKLLAEWRDNSGQDERHLRLQADWPERMHMLNLKRGGRPLGWGLGRHMEAFANVAAGETVELVSGEFATSTGKRCNNTAYDPPTKRGKKAAELYLGPDVDAFLREHGFTNVAAFSSNAERAFRTTHAAFNPYWGGNIGLGEALTRIQQIEAFQERVGGPDNAYQLLDGVRERYPNSTTELTGMYTQGESILLSVARPLDAWYHASWFMPNEVEFAWMASHTWPLAGLECWFTLGAFDPTWMDDIKREISNLSFRELWVVDGEASLGRRHVFPTTA